MSQFQGLSKTEKPLLGVKVRAKAGPEHKIDFSRYEKPPGNSREEFLLAAEKGKISRDKV